MNIHTDDVIRYLDLLRDIGDIREYHIDGDSIVLVSKVVHDGWKTGMRFWRIAETLKEKGYEIGKPENHHERGWAYLRVRVKKVKVK